MLQLQGDMQGLNRSIRPKVTAFCLSTTYTVLIQHTENKDIKFHPTPKNHHTQLVKLHKTDSCVHLRLSAVIGNKCIIYLQEAMRCIPGQ